LTGLFVCITIGFAGDFICVNASQPGLYNGHGDSSPYIKSGKDSHRHSPCHGIGLVIGLDPIDDLNSVGGEMHFATIRAAYYRHVFDD
jgi:hypothetical protein